MNRTNWVVSQEKRRALIERLLKASSRDEAEAAEIEATRHLTNNPNDHGVMAAHQRLEKRNESIGGPLHRDERSELRWAVTLLALAVLTVIFFVEHGLGWTAAIGAGLVLSLEAFYWTWIYFGRRPERRSPVSCRQRRENRL